MARRLSRLDFDVFFLGTAIVADIAILHNLPILSDQFDFIDGDWVLGTRKKLLPCPLHPIPYLAAGGIIVVGWFALGIAGFVSNRRSDRAVLK